MKFVLSCLDAFLCTTIGMLITFPIFVLAFVFLFGFIGILGGLGMVAAAIYAATGNLKE